MSVRVDKGSWHGEGREGGSGWAGMVLGELGSDGGDNDGDGDREIDVA